MPRLIVNPGSPNAREIQLKPGTNLIGRGFANDFKLEDPSVSGSHCQILVDSGHVMIKDLGSTNGTYVNRAPVREAQLQPGQTVHLGGVEMMFYGDGAAPVRAPQPAAAPVPVGAPRLVAAPRALSAVATHAVAAPVAHAVAAPPAAPPMPQAAGVGPGLCKFHPKTQGRYYCNHCQHHYCELCVTSRPIGGVQHKYCRQCGAECVAVQVNLQHIAPSSKGFFARLPGAFVYPLRGSGLLVLLVGTILFAALKFFGGGLNPRMLWAMRSGLSFSWWVLIFQVFVTGYLFAYMQAVIHSTAVEDPEMPALPSMANFWEDILLPCLELLGLVLICFGPAIAFGWYMASSEEPPTNLSWVLIALFALGCVYFPMAFLAVAMLDSVTAANPLQVVPSIFKAPLEYLVTIIVLASLLGFRSLGDELLPQLFPRGLTTHNMAKLFGYLGTQAFWSITCLYLLTVGMHVLGLLYVSKKDKLGWLDH